MIPVKANIVTLSFLSLFIIQAHCITQGTPLKDLKDAPYQVSIRLKTKDGNFGAGFLCSGVLIDRWNVLTSAKCVHDSVGKLLPAESFTLVFGTIYRTKAPSQHLSRNVKAMYVKENVNVAQRYSDIAVLRLDEGIPETSTDIKVLELRQDTVKGNTDCSLTGWGSSSDKGEYEDVLQTVTLKVMGPLNCNASAGVLGRPLDPDHICAGAKGKGACHGDLGAPLVCEKLLTGIVTLETGCGSSGRHAIFTSVSTHNDWIEAVRSKDMDNSAATYTNGVFFNLIWRTPVFFIHLICRFWS